MTDPFEYMKSKPVGYEVSPGAVTGQISEDVACYVAKDGPERLLRIVRGEGAVNLNAAEAVALAAYISANVRKRW
jgi:hypothetical protein